MKEIPENFRDVRKILLNQMALIKENKRNKNVLAYMEELADDD